MIREQYNTENGSLDVDGASSITSSIVVYTTINDFDQAVISFMDTGIERELGTIVEDLKFAERQKLKQVNLKFFNEKSIDILIRELTKIKNDLKNPDSFCYDSDIVAI